MYKRQYFDREGNFDPFQKSKRRQDWFSDGRTFDWQEAESFQLETLRGLSEFFSKKEIVRFYEVRVEEMSTLHNRAASNLNALKAGNGDLSDSEHTTLRVDFDRLRSKEDALTRNHSEAWFRFCRSVEQLKMEEQVALSEILTTDWEEVQKLPARAESFGERLKGLSNWDWERKFTDLLSSIEDELASVELRRAVHPESADALQSGLESYRADIQTILNELNKAGLPRVYKEELNAIVSSYSQITAWQYFVQNFAALLIVFVALTLAVLATMRVGILSLFNVLWIAGVLITFGVFLDFTEAVLKDYQAYRLENTVSEPHSDEKHEIQ